MSPIYVRPEREQAEHDRLIRFLQEKYGHSFEALANPGDERTAPVKLAGMLHFPDLVLNDDKRLAGLIEIETAASVNNLETMAKWVPYSRARVPFHLYVPVQGYEAALRLADAHHVKAAEIWTYRPAVEGFDLVRMFADPAQQQLKPPKASATARAAKAPAAPAAPAKGSAARPKPVPAKAAKKVAKVAAKATKKPARAPAVRKTAAKAKAPARKAAPRKAIKAPKTTKPTGRAAKPARKPLKKAAKKR